MNRPRWIEGAMVSTVVIVSVNVLIFFFVVWAGYNLLEFFLGWEDAVMSGQHDLCEDVGLTLDECMAQPFYIEKY